MRDQKSLNIGVLGATGSVASSLFAVAQENRLSFDFNFFSAKSNWQQLATLSRLYKPEYVHIEDQHAFKQLEASLKDTNITCVTGRESLLQLCADSKLDCVLGAYTGASGLIPNHTVLQAGTRLLLANKESMVIAGNILQATSAENKAEIIPVDSEHSALFQCFSGIYGTDLWQSKVVKATITASGGALLNFHKSHEEVTLQDAMAHPVWKMGQKITVDSATMMNKGLELLEAKYLFALKPNQLGVVVNPQSKLHAYVEFLDGTSVAQLSQPDMKIPVAVALTWPEKLQTDHAPLSVYELANLELREPDLERFPCLKLAFECLATEDGSNIVLNAANEVAVDAFISNKIKFSQIAQIVDNSLSKINSHKCIDIDETVEFDRECRVTVTELIDRI